MSEVARTKGRHFHNHYRTAGVRQFIHVYISRDLDGTTALISVNSFGKTLENMFVEVVINKIAFLRRLAKIHN